MAWRLIECFHDKDRYFIPLLLIGLFFMILGASHLFPVSFDYEVIINGSLLFSDDAVIKAIVLRPGWDLSFNLITSKPVNLSVINLNGVTVAFSDSSSIVFSPDFFDLYFIKVHGVDYAILDADYSILGLTASPLYYSFFGFGLALILGVCIFWLLRPWAFKWVRYLSAVDGVFYTVFFMLSFLVFFIFLDALLWFIPKSLDGSLLFVVFCFIFFISGLIVMNFIPVKKRDSYFFKVLGSYVIAYSMISLTAFLDLILSGYIVLMVYGFIVFLLSIIALKLRERVALVIYLIYLFSIVMINLMAYSIGVPVVFERMLSIPVEGNFIQLLLILEFFGIMGVYFIVRGYASRTKELAISNGLYAAVCINFVIQILAGVLV